MKFRIYTLILALLCLGLSSSLAAQNNRAERAKERAERRANNKVDNKIDRKVDRAVDDAFDAIGGLFKKKKKKKEKADEQAPQTGSEEELTDDASESADMLGSLFGGEWEPYTNPKTFSMTWTVEETKRNGKSETTVMKLSMDEQNSAMQISNPDKPKQDAWMIFNTQDGMTTTIAEEDGELRGTRMRMPNIGNLVEKEMEKQAEEGRYTVERTGERRNISGYECEKIVITDTKKGTKIVNWMTQEAGISWREASQAFIGGMTGGVTIPDSEVTNETQDFMVILSTMEDNGKTYETRVSDIKVGDQADSLLLDTGDIPIETIRY